MPESPFEFQGINHLALVCKDMARTVSFYRDVLGLRLIKTIELPMGMGQHFFFDCGGNNTLAFFLVPGCAARCTGGRRPGLSARHRRTLVGPRFDEPCGLQRAR